MFDFSEIPAKPGVYLFKNNLSSVIYIGKAVNLKNRIRSYWAKSSWQDRPKLAVLVPQIKDFEIFITQNEREALILEAGLIKRHQPKYNVLLKEQVNFPWLSITYGEDFPRLLPVFNLTKFRKKFPKAKFFGPYVNRQTMYRSLELARELFPLRKRDKPLFKHRVCLNFHLNKCLGPCQKLISKQDYKFILGNLELFLEGKHPDLLKSFDQKMHAYSEKLEFEKAQSYKEKITLVSKLKEKQSVVSSNQEIDRDLISIIKEPEIKVLLVLIFKVRKGELVNREKYLLELNAFQNLEESINSVISQIYLNSIEKLPREILIDLNCESFENKEKIKDLLERNLELIKDKSLKYKIKVAFPERGKKREELNLVVTNAKSELEKILFKQKKKNLILEALKQTLCLKNLPIEIDCFDVSHLQGTEVVASCIRFTKNLPNKKFYRRIKISIDQNNDFIAMEEAVYRRYQKLKDLPDLILIDGGIGQLNSASKALKKLGLLSKVDLCSLAKKEERIFLESKNSILLEKSDQGLQVLIYARDEAHRFALKYNRLRRNKKIVGN